MDPNTTWKEIQRAIANVMYKEALEKITNMISWIHKGGFAPIGFTDPTTTLCVMYTLQAAISEYIKEDSPDGPNY